MMSATTPKRFVNPFKVSVTDLMIQRLKNRVAKATPDNWTEDADRAALALAYLYSRIYRA